MGTSDLTIGASSCSSLDSIADLATDFPLDSTDCLKLDELGLTWTQLEVDLVVALFVAFDCQTTQREDQFLLQSLVRLVVHVVIDNTGLVLVLVLVDLVGLLSASVNTLRLLSLSHAQLLQLLRPVHHCAHHDLAGQGEAGWVHLAEHDSFLLPWEHLDVIAGSLEWLLHL